ncbi:MAG: MFS transporter [Chlorobiaceae bacterium]|nr:MFS transporter [Chlorobiaceae bacterium]NTW10900.1 MFS transporter [Chlorobiaceae bacterium]
MSPSSEVPSSPDSVGKPGEFPAGPGQKIISAFPAFTSRNFRLYFTGQIVSMIGTWLQMVAQGWLVYDMTHSAFWTGATAAASSLPTLFLSLFGGVIVDRYNRKTILLWTQAASMLLAFVLGTFTLAGSVTVTIILVLAFLLGCVAAVSTPAVQAFLSEMVDRDQLHSAVALNAAIFNASRVIGPAIAGLTIAWIGAGGAFMANGLSYLAVIVALLAIRTQTPPVNQDAHLPALQSIREGIVYTWQHPILRTIILFVSVISIFGWSFMSMLPVVARDTFRMGSDGMGYLYSAFGIGSLAGTVLVSMSSGKVRATLLVTGGILLFSLALTAFTFTTEQWVAFAFLFIAGIGLLSAFATMTATVQRLVEDRYRGRVMSIYLMVLMGFMPIGNLQVGLLAEHFGTAVAIRTGSIIVMFAAVFLYLNRGEIEKGWKEFRETDA